MCGRGSSSCIDLADLELKLIDFTVTEILDKDPMAYFNQSPGRGVICLRNTGPKMPSLFLMSHDVVALANTWRLMGTELPTFIPSWLNMRYLLKLLLWHYNLRVTNSLEVEVS